MYRNILERRGGGGALWVVVLAGGDGTRLERITSSEHADRRPKQFCDFGTGRTLLQRAVQRARMCAPDDRVCVATQRIHRHAVRDDLGHLSLRIDEQPDNAGTLPALLLSLLRLVPHDPDAVVLVMPADHWIARPRPFIAAALRAGAIARTPDEPVVSLGVALSDAQDGYGWLLPGSLRPDGSRSVERFHEKPSAPQLRELMALGAVANTFVFAARARTLLQLISEARPDWVQAMCDGAHDDTILAAAYRQLAPACLSRTVLQPFPERMAVLGIEPVVGWSDVGTPERLTHALATAVSDRRWASAS